MCDISVHTSGKRSCLRKHTLWSTWLWTKNDAIYGWLGKGDYWISNIPAQDSLLQVSSLNDSPSHFPPFRSWDNFDLFLWRVPPPQVAEQGPFCHVPHSHCTERIKLISDNGNDMSEVGYIVLTWAVQNITVLLFRCFTYAFSSILFTYDFCSVICS